MLICRKIKQTMRGVGRVDIECHQQGDERTQES